MTEQITFIEVNPGLGSFGFAAEKIGMLRLGPARLSMDVRQAYVEFHGAGSDDLIDDTADLAVADLPFSLFLDGKNADPDVTDVIVSARDSVRRGGYALFRVKWDIALRLGTDVSGYVAAVSAGFPKYAVKAFVDHSAPSDAVSTCDLYILASPADVVFEARPQLQPGSVTAIHPIAISKLELADDDPQQILGLLGFPEDFHRVAGSVPHVEDRIRESVIISRAAEVLETVASHLRG